MDFEQAYVKIYNQGTYHYAPSLKAVKEMHVGDSVVTHWNNENTTILRKITKIDYFDNLKPKSILNMYANLSGGEQPGSKPLFEIPILWVIPIKHGYIFKVFEEGI